LDDTAAPVEIELPGNGADPNKVEVLVFDGAAAENVLELPKSDAPEEPGSFW
jgi:hypothetical protein